MTELRTPRLRLRRARADDLDALHAVLSDPRAMRYWSTLPHDSRETTRAWLAGMIASPPALSDDFVVERAGRAIGKAGFYRLPEIGYILHPDAWGQGLGREACAAVIGHVFASRPEVHELTADADPRNAASIALLTRLGFRKTGEARRTYQLGDEWADSAWFALGRADWLARGPRP